MGVKKLSSFPLLNSIDKDNDLIPVSKSMGNGIYETSNVTPSTIASNLGLGEAAYLNVGTAQNELVQVQPNGKIDSSLIDLPTLLSSPLETKGDIWVHDGTVNTKLSIGTGTNGQVLKLNSQTETGLEWNSIAYSEISGTPTLLSSPLETKGDIWVHNGTVNTKLSIGTSTNGQVLTANSATETGLEWSNLPSSLSSPLTTEGDLWYYDGLNNTRLPKGVKGQVLTQGYGTGATGLEWRYSAGYGLELVLNNASLNASSGGKFHEVHTLSGDVTINLDSIDNYVPYYFYNNGTNQVIFSATGTFLNSINKITIPYGFAKVLKIGVGYIVDTSFTGDYNDLKNKPPSLSSPLEAKGDIWTYSTTQAKLSIGTATNGQILKINSQTETGLEWNNISYSEISGTPILGSAAFLESNQVVQYQYGTKLPPVDGSQLINLPIPYQSFKATQTASYTIVQSDHGLWIPCNTNNLTITLPNGLATGTQVIIDRQGSATVTVTASTTLIGKNVSANSVAIANQYGVVHCVHQGSNIWRITGDL